MGCCCSREIFGVVWCVFVFFFKQKTAYELRISDWSSDVCSSDLGLCGSARPLGGAEEWAWAAGVASATVATPALGAERGRLAHPFLSSVPQKSGPEIGRASWRERVCQYV